MAPDGDVPAIDAATFDSIRAAANTLARQYGRGVPKSAVIALASNLGARLTVLDGDPPVAVVHPPRAGADPLFTRLTRREREIAGLVAAGLPNAEIAAELVLSIATVKDHVHRILRKTGLPSRAAVAAAWRG